MNIWDTWNAEAQAALAEPAAELRTVEVHYFRPGPDGESLATYAVAALARDWDHINQGRTVLFFGSTLRTDDPLYVGVAYGPADLPADAEIATRDEHGEVDELWAAGFTRVRRIADP